MTRSFVIAAAVAALTSNAAWSDDDIKPLKIGEPAPAIDVSNWIQGGKVAKFEPGKVYVLEFWATWCGPCKQSMPHLGRLQQDYKDYGVTIIGVSDEEPKIVNDFLAKNHPELDKKWSEVVAYTVATDPDRSVAETYMYGVGAMGIPAAFIIGKDGKVEWSGNPHPQSGDDFDKALEAVVKDNWDRDAFAKEFEPQAEKNRQTLNARLAERAKIKKFKKLLGVENKPDEAYAYGETIIEEYWQDAQKLNEIAWFVVDDPSVKSRNLEFALKVVTQANDLTEGKDAMILDTFARVYFEQGDVKNAIRVQKKAVEYAAGPMKADIESTLKKYEDELAKQSGKN